MNPVKITVCEDCSRSTKVQTSSIVKLQGDFFLTFYQKSKIGPGTPNCAVSVDGNGKD